MQLNLIITEVFFFKKKHIINHNKMGKILILDFAQTPFNFHQELFDKLKHVS